MCQVAVRISCAIAMIAFLFEPRLGLLPADLLLRDEAVELPAPMGPFRPARPA